MFTVAPSLLHRSLIGIRFEVVDRDQLGVGRLGRLLLRHIRIAFADELDRIEHEVAGTRTAGVVLQLVVVVVHIDGEGADFESSF